MKLFLYIGIGVLIGHCMPMYAYIYEIKTLRKWNPEHQRYDYFIGMSDFHDKVHVCTASQRAVIEESLKLLNAETAKVLVEDLCSANACGSRIANNFQIASKGGILAGLGDFCHKYAIPFENVEYRYCRVVTMGPVINNLHASPHLFLSTRSIKVGAVINEIDYAMKQLNNEISNPVLRKTYQQEAKSVRTLLDRLKLTKHREVSVADFLYQACTAHNKVDVLKHLLTFDSSLLDLKIAHEVVSSTSKHAVVAIAGGTHIRNACTILKKTGFEEYKNTPLSYSKQKEVSQCLGSNIINGAFCAKPHPLEVAVIKEHLSVALP